MGLFENKAFSKGTFEVALALSNNDGFTMVGGGDSVAAVKKAQLESEISHISTGGGASLEFIEKGHLPGIQALKENGIRSPLVETKFIKSEIRDIAKSVGLSVHDRPANSCLASRIPWGQRVTAERLTRIELGETLVKQLTNLKQVRVRDIQGCAKIEVDIEKISIFNESIIDQLSEKLKVIGFTSVEIDRDGYKPGKINVISN